MPPALLLDRRLLLALAAGLGAGGLAYAQTPSPELLP